MISDEFSQWMRSVAMAAKIHCMMPDSLYYGVDGAKRLARECGPAILDFGDYGKKNIGSTYGAICVIAYDLKPPINAKDWIMCVREGFERANNYRHGGMKDEVDN